MASTTALPRFLPLTTPGKPAAELRARKAIAIGAREAMSLKRKRLAVFVDLRDWEIMDQTGWIEGAMHCPPGEFANIISPTSPLHTRLFEPGKTFIFYGGPQVSPLASARRARDLGLDGALALRGGLKAWRAAGGRIAGHPNSAFPALKASVLLATKYTRDRLSAWWRGDKKRGPARKD